MKKLLFTAAICLAITGCENMGSMSGNGPSHQRIDVKNQTIEAHAQRCTKRGFRPGSRKFTLCMNRSAERAVGKSPKPKRRPASRTTKRAGN